MESPQPTTQASPHPLPETPRLGVDAIIDMGAGLVLLVERKFPPQGWALPGGFVEIGETVEEAVLREVKEETGLDVEIVRLFHVYSDPKRDERGHTVSIAFLCRGWAGPNSQPKAGDDAKNVGLYHYMNLPAQISFDHRQVLKDYFDGRY